MSGGGLDLEDDWDLFGRERSEGMLWSLVLGLDRRLLMDGTALIVARAATRHGRLLWALALEASAAVGGAYVSQRWRGADPRGIVRQLLLSSLQKNERGEA